MRSPDHPVERDLDVADLRRQPPMGSVKRGHGATRGRRGLRRYLVGIMVALVLALFTAVVWFAYQDLMPGGNAVPPLIRADAGELKRAPDERGGLPLINAESAVVQALDEPESPVRVERIVPRRSEAPRSTADVIPEALEAEPEAAASRARAGETMAGAPQPAAGGTTAGGDIADGGLADGGLADDVSTGPVVADSAAAGADPGNGEAAGTDTLDTLLAEIIESPAEPNLIEPAAGPLDEADPLPSPADGTALPEVALPEAKAPEVNARAASAASPPTAATRPSEMPATTAGAERAPAEPSTAPAEPSSAPGETSMAALPNPTLAPSFDGAFRVQLLAATDEAAVVGAWAGLQARYPSTLGPLRSAVQRAEIGGSTFFRLHAGPFADQSGANAVCAALQAQGTDCFVVAPAS